MRSVPAIAFDYAPSRWLVAATVAMAALALLAIAFCGLNLWGRAALASAACGYAAWSLRGFLRPPFARAVWHSAGHWRLTDAAGNERAGELRHWVVLGTALIVLTLRIGSKQTTLWLLPDNCTAETQRQLRVRLRRTAAADSA